jgi:hypothetical protein
MMAHLHRFVVVGVFVASAWMLLPRDKSAAATQPYRTVARTGDDVPGAPPGTDFTTFLDPVLNGAGLTAFGARFTGNVRGIWSEGSGQLEFVAARGGQAPGTPAGAVFDSLMDPPLLSDSGHVAFYGFLQSGLGGVHTNNNTGVWSNRSGTLALVARNGSQAPGTPAGAVFSDFAYVLHPPAINGLGQIAFFGSLDSGGGGGVAGGNDAGIWSEADGVLHLVRREGSQAPGTPAGAIFESFSAPVTNDDGDLGFIASLRNNFALGVNENTNDGIWVQRNAALVLVAREGSHASGTAANSLFGQFEELTFNESGQVAFYAGLQLNSGDVTFSNNRGIWAERGGSLALVARAGSQAPDTPAGANFAGFNPPRDQRQRPCRLFGRTAAGYWRCRHR